MSPFKRIEHHERRPILRKRGRSEVTFSTPPESPAGRKSDHRRVPDTSPSKRPIRKKKRNVQFSPYNRVHLISPRKAGDELHIRQLYASIQEGEYENSEDEEEEWTKTQSNGSTPDDDSSSN